MGRYKGAMRLHQFDLDAAKRARTVLVGDSLPGLRQQQEFEPNQFAFYIVSWPKNVVLPMSS